MFATCSDDHTVCLWDLRNMNKRVCTLRGHSDMVKSIEFIRPKGLILTSAFDGNINLWDINWSVTVSRSLFIALKRSAMKLQ